MTQIASRTPTLAEVIRISLEAFAQGLMVSRPGRVVAIDAALQCVDVLPLLQERTVLEDGSEQNERMPVVSRCPIVFPGGGGFRLSFPVAVGDQVLLLWTDRALDKWKQHGDEVDPIDLRRHHISDAIALVGLMDFGHATAVPLDRVSLSKPGGPSVELTASDVILNGGSAAVSRQGDSVGPTADMTAWMAAVAGYINGVSPGAVAPAAPATFGTITSGAPHVKG